MNLTFFPAPTNGLPTVFAQQTCLGSASLQRRTAAGPASGDMNDGKWSGESSRKGGFRMDDQQVRNSIKGTVNFNYPQI